MPQSLDSTVVDAIVDVRARCNCAPFLTLGQTVLWDEPAKAAFCRALETVAPEAVMLAGVHDTDYFAKLPHDALGENSAEFVMLPHNDGSTRALWSAAGEISSFLGSETVPTRGALAEDAGVSFDRAARAVDGGLDALLDAETEAPGWRALVHTEPHPLIAADVKLEEIAEPLRAQLAWALEESLQIVGTDAARATGTTLRGWIDEYLDFNPTGTLSDLYRALIPRLWNLVRGEGSCNLLHSTSTELFRFNRETCTLPRFRFVDLFLKPETRDIARRCYNDAVRGGGMYALDAFGEGALPFDIVVRGKGRGTLRIHNGSVFIETEEPQTLCADCNPDSVESLAALLESQFGPDVVLVGKAVALISMLSAEFVFVFHEKASSYTSRTQQMNAAIREAGIALQLLPMLRLKYQTWNALETVEADFNLPPHFARAWKTETVSAKQFALSWQSVRDEQIALLQTLKSLHSPRELLQFLSTVDFDGTSWESKREEYEAARAAVKALRKQADEYTECACSLREEADAANARGAAIEREKGAHWRAHLLPLQRRISDIREAAAQRLAQTTKLSKEERVARAQLEQSEETEVETLRAQFAEAHKERTRLREAIAAERARARECKAEAKQKLGARLELEKSEQSRAARETLQRLESEAELERLRRARDAYVVSHSLEYTNVRPTAWWFPLVSPDGAWLARLTQTMTARIEEL
ncbi:MAG TPA: hypothetical protein VF681_07795 [Abditibacteriaceae bacterium]|jgi:hypothetical protein